MLLEDLVTAIQTVQARIREHGTTLSQNEYRTRISLIDPILNALAWDVSDPGLVTVEYQAGNGRADYALLGSDGKPKAFIEAKRLNEPLDSHQGQVFKYTWDQKVFYGGLTDGNRWVLEDVTAAFSGREGRILDLKISQETAYRCALKLLLLWRRTFSDGEPIEANESVLGSSSEVETLVDNPIETQKTRHSGERLIPLSEYKPRKDDPLPAIQFPGETERQVKKWFGLVVEIAEWLIRKGMLTKGSCPVPGAAKGYSMINSVPEHENGVPLFHPERLSNGLYLNKQGNRDTLLSNARSLLEYFEKDPTDIFLKPN